jgi:hypothetical protein
MAEDTNENELTGTVNDNAPASAEKPKRKPKTAAKKVAKKEGKKVVKKTATKKSTAVESTPREPIDLAKAKKNDYSIDTNNRVRVKCVNPKCKGGEKGTSYTGARATNLDAPCPRCGNDTIQPVINAEKKTPGRTAGDGQKTTKKVAKKTATKKGAKRGRKPAQKEAA